jgi:hypothetical protein
MINEVPGWIDTVPHGATSPSALVLVLGISSRRHKRLCKMLGELLPRDRLELRMTGRQIDHDFRKLRPSACLLFGRKRT